MVEPKKLLPSVEKIVREAGDILISYFRKNDLNSHEKTLGNPVTEADLASEKFLIEQLGKLVAQASFFAEESGQTEKKEYCWVIDPLDGTVNFAHGMDYFCISVALTRDDKPILAVVYRPIGNEMFTAIAGSGAHLNGNKITVSPTSDIDKSYVGICLPYAEEYFEHALTVLNRLARNCYGIRKLGSAVLDQANVACGRMDAVLFEDLGWWDVAAGMLLVQEAGGFVADYHGNVVDSGYASFIATNKHLYKELQQMAQ